MSISDPTHEPFRMRISEGTHESYWDAGEQMYKIRPIVKAAYVSVDPASFIPYPKDDDMAVRMLNIALTYLTVNAPSRLKVV